PALYAVSLDDALPIWPEESQKSTAARSTTTVRSPASTSSVNRDRSSSEECRSMEPRAAIVARPPCRVVCKASPTPPHLTDCWSPSCRPQNDEGNVGVRRL